MTPAPSLKNLVAIFETMVKDHPAVKTFGTGERVNISLDGGTNPILVWLEQPFNRRMVNPRGGNKTREIDLSFLVLDLPKSTDRSDELDIISRCDLVADWILLRMTEAPPIVMQVIGDPSVLTVTEYGADLWAGVRVEVRVVTPIPLGACDVRKFNE